jgi:hypothetical protein
MGYSYMGRVPAIWVTAIWVGLQLYGMGYSYMGRFTAIWVTAIWVELQLYG